MIINPYLVQPNVPAFSFLLDTYSGAAVAYSAARRLSSTYTGALIRVRRSSDNTEQDIGYTAGNLLDEAALTTFVGAGNGFVTTWYDQSGNALNVTQTTADNQPKIVSSGTVEKEGSKPCVSFDGVNDILVKSLASIGYLTTFSVLKYNNINTKVAISDSLDSVYLNIAFSDTFRAYVNAYKVGDASNTNRNLHYLLINSTNCIIGTNGSTNTTAGTPTTSMNGIAIGRSIAGFASDSKIQEVIVYSANKSSDRTSIESNINTFYSIY